MQTLNEAQEAYQNKLRFRRECNIILENMDWDVPFRFTTQEHREMSFKRVYLISMGLVLSGIYSASKNKNLTLEQFVHAFAKHASKKIHMSFGNKYYYKASKSQIKTMVYYELIDHAERLIEEALSSHSTAIAA